MTEQEGLDYINKLIDDALANVKDDYVREHMEARRSAALLYYKLGRAHENHLRHVRLNNFVEKYLYELTAKQLSDLVGIME